MDSGAPPCYNGVKQKKGSPRHVHCILCTLLHPVPTTAALNNTAFTTDELEAIDKASGFYKE